MGSPDYTLPHLHPTRPNPLQPNPPRPAPTQPADPLMAEAEAERLRLEKAAIRNATGGQPVSIQQNKPRGFKLPGM